MQSAAKGQAIVSELNQVDVHKMGCIGLNPKPNIVNEKFIRTIEICQCNAGFSQIRVYS